MWFWVCSVCVLCVCVCVCVCQGWHSQREYIWLWVCSVCVCVCVCVVVGPGTSTPSTWASVAGAVVIMSAGASTGGWCTSTPTSACSTCWPSSWIETQYSRHLALYMVSCG